MFVKLQDVLNILGRYSNALSDPPIDEQELIELKIVHKLYHAIKDEVLIHNVEPVRHGEWREETEYYDDEYSECNVRKVFACSLCGRTKKYKQPYCNCGAKMDGSKTSLPFGIQRSAEEVGNSLKTLHNRMFVDGGNE